MPTSRAPRDLADQRFVRALDDTPDELVVGEAVALDVQTAGLALRVAAGLLDAVCLGALYLLLFIGLALVWPGDVDPVWFLSARIAITVIAFVLLPAGVETVTHGKSVGRYAAGTRVVRLDGGSITFRHAFTRAVVGLLELWSTFGALAFLVALFGPRTRRLGDLLAGTVVQHERAAGRPDPAVLLPAELVPWAAVADVSALPQRLENRLGAFFRSAGSVRPGFREQAAATLAAEVVPYVHPLPEVHPEALLAGVVALRRERDLRALTARAGVLAAAAATAGARPPGFPAR